MWLVHMDLVFQEGCSGRTNHQRATGWMRVTHPWEVGQTTHVHPVFPVLLLALAAWMNSFSSETLLQLQFASGQRTWQGQD